MKLRYSPSSPFVRKVWLAVLELGLEDRIERIATNPLNRDDVVNFRNQMEAVRARMADLIRSGMPKSEASDRIQTQDISWTLAENGLFMQRSIPGFYDEIAAELRE